MIKYELIPEQLLYEGTITDENLFAPTPISAQTVLTTHTSEYWNKLSDQNLTAKEIRKIGFPMTPNLIERGLHIVGGTIACARYALQYGAALNIAGGTHHSYADHGEGFCIFNDIAIAANYLLNRKLAQNILVVDLDVHQGNGTAHIFQHNPQVFTFSMHGAKNYPTRKEQSDLDIGLPDNCGDQEYLDTLAHHLPQLIAMQKPDFIFYLSGVDVLATDKLGRLGISLLGCKARDRFVLEMAKEQQIPVAVSMGGGYSEKISIIIEAHANTFRLAAELFSPE